MELDKEQFNTNEGQLMMLTGKGEGGSFEEEPDLSI